MSAPCGPAPATWTLVTRAQAGDRDAYADIYRQYLPMVRGWIYTRTRNVHLTEDLTADTFARALRGINTVTWQGRDIGAWLRTIARNRVADHYKSGRYRCETATIDWLDAEPVDTSEYGTPGVEYLNRETRQTLVATLRAAAAVLTDEQIQALDCRYLRGMTIAETAAAMGKTEGAVKSLTYRAAKLLARNERLAALAGAA